MTGIRIPNDVVDVPPAAKLVYLFLDLHGPCTRAELRRRTGLSDKTLDSALDALRDAKVLSQTQLPGDARKSEYGLDRSP